MAIKAIIFDMDGTLVDSEHEHWSAWHEVFIKNNPHLNFPESNYFKYVGRGDMEAVEEMLKDSNTEMDAKKAVEEKQEAFQEIFPNSRLREGVYEKLMELKKKYKLGLATSSVKKDVVVFLKSHRLDNFFDATVAGDEVKRKKPNPDIFLEAARRLGVKPSECVGVEDSEMGMKAVKNAGMYCIGFPNRYTKNQSMQYADIVIQSFSDIDKGLNQRVKE